MNSNDKCGDSLMQLYLRKPTPDDLLEIAQAYKTSKAIHQPWAFAPTNLETYLEEDHRYFLCLRANHSIVGTFNISGVIRGGFQSAYLGYEVFFPYQNKGYMSQGLTLLLEEAFNILNLHRLEANIQPDNIASIKLVAKTGFIKEGYSRHYLNIGNTGWKDHERWAIINDHWMAQ
jgi:[ribosomal protein S5]-alanine N-acetyltransferase